MGVVSLYYQNLTSYKPTRFSVDQSKRLNIGVTRAEKNYGKICSKPSLWFLVLYHADWLLTVGHISPFHPHTELLINESETPAPVMTRQKHGPRTKKRSARLD